MSRPQSIRWQVAAAAVLSVSAVVSAATNDVQLEPWYATAALTPGKNLSDAHFPEKGLDPTSKDPAVESLWRKRGRWQDGEITKLGSGSNTIAYVFREIIAAKPTRLPIYVGCDDHMMIWLNGENVHTCTERHAVRPDTHKIELSLRKGSNKLLMKIRNNGGVFAFYFSTKPGAKVPPAAKAKKPARQTEEAIDLPALRRAIEDLTRAFPQRYGQGGRTLQRLAEFEKLLPTLSERIQAGEAEALRAVSEFNEFRREALLANPLLHFERLLLVRRGAKSPKMGMPANWQGNTSLPRSGYDDEILVLSPVRPDGKLTTLYKPPAGRFVGDVELHFDAGKMLFSSQADNGRWHVFEIAADPTAPLGEPAGEPRQLTPAEPADVDNYDGCYLPDGRIIFSSTACVTGVPCVRGGSHVANLYLLNADGSARQLCFDQDHNWSPTMLPTGRVLFTRWEYGDIPHAFSRILFHMNPDGTGQAEYYGSNSYWPNSIFYARPIPHQPTKFVGIVSGHHGVARIGEMIVFDTARARFEADGALQRIGEYGKKVEPILLDRLVDASWPKFLHPYPLSDAATGRGAGKYFLASAQTAKGEPWCIYLVDVWDNMVKLCEAPGSALLEPVPWRKTPRPPAIPERIDLGRKDALVMLTNIYAGPGLAGVPRGSIKKLRLFTYHFAYQGMGGQQDRIGLDGPWDVKRVLGTVPVEADGSAAFCVPANTPISLQPLDADGQAVQHMRSWLTAMPGESVSCVGCHERQDEAPAPSPLPTAFAREPSEIQPWYGPVRGMSFKREVQPVLDRYCIGCHDGSERADGWTIPDLRAKDDVSYIPSLKSNQIARFSPSYYAVRRFVRTSTMEGDLHMLAPWDVHAETTRLVQMLRKGHHGVTLDAEAWDRIITWIDLGAPAHGNWRDIVGAERVDGVHKRRMELQKLYADMDQDPEAVVAGSAKKTEPVVPKAPPAKPAAPVTCAGWPFDAAEAKRRQDAAGPTTQMIELPGGGTMKLVRIPAGGFVMGSRDGHADERPQAAVTIGRVFWMGVCEVTNDQYRQFDASHDSRLEHGGFLHFSVRERGYPLSDPNQPVARVSWDRATAFCRWLSAKTGRRFTLPTEAQWEYACRAGTATPLNYGAVDTDHAALANLGDINVKTMEKLGFGLPFGAIPPWHPTDGRVDDKARVSADVGGYAVNAWGLHDTHGNVWEWTRTSYRAYPYRDDDGRNDPDPTGRKVVRGGSWYDRPQRARSAFRLSYRPYHRVYDVGFRVICEE